MKDILTEKLLKTGQICLKRETQVRGCAHKFKSVGKTLHTLEEKLKKYLSLVTFGARGGFWAQTRSSNCGSHSLGSEPALPTNCTLGPCSTHRVLILCTAMVGASFVGSPWVLLLVWDCSAEFITHLLLVPTHLLAGTNPTNTAFIKS